MNSLYKIDMPPPTISGNLHMRHAFSYSQMDILARYHRMKGKNLLYPFGYDNNGIPTEKFAFKSGIDDPEETIRLSKKKSEDYFQFFDSIGMGFSEHRYNTFSDMTKELSRLSFEDLKNKGLCYQKQEAFSFCEKCQLSIPDSEIENNRHLRDGGNITIKEEMGWFIKTTNIKNELISMANEIDWRPAKFQKRMINWIKDIDRDWSISRRRNYGIEIPDGSGLKFDTWFTSSLTPQIAWASYTGKPSLDAPIFDLRFQAHDIITTWALYTMIKSYYHSGQIPWKKIIITGHATDNKGDKFAKSKGNFSDPWYYINEYGANGIRNWSTQNQIGTDTAIDEDIMAGAKKWEIKWENTGKFIDFQKSKGWLGKDEGKEKEWEDTKISIDEQFELGEYPKAYELLSDFFWKRFCSTFIEESKKNSCSLSLEDIRNDMEPYWRIFFPFIK